MQRLSQHPWVVRALRWWWQRTPSRRRLAVYIGLAVRNFFTGGLQSAAALSYYTIFSIFPLTLLLAVGIGELLGPVVARQQIAQGLALFLPAETVAFVQDNLAVALEQGGSFGLVALIGLFWSGLGLFSSLTFTLDGIFRVPRGRSLWRQRLVATGMAVMLILLVATSFITGGVLRLVSSLFVEQPNVWLSIGVTFLPISLNMVIFALVFRFVPSRRVSWDAVWPAAIFGGTGWELARIGFAWYLGSLARFQLVYGGIAAVIVLLFWAYLIAAIFLLSAELCARLNEWHEEMLAAQRPPRLFGRPRRELPAPVGRN